MSSSVEVFQHRTRAHVGVLANSASGLPLLRFHAGLVCVTVLSGSGSLRVSFHFIPRTQWDKFYYQSPVTEKLEKFNTVFKLACFVNYQVRFWTQVWLIPKPLFLPTQLSPSCVCRIKGVGGGGAQCRVANWQRAGQIQLTHVLIGRHGTFGCQYLTIRVHTKIWFSTCL